MGDHSSSGGPPPEPSSLPGLPEAPPSRVDMVTLIRQGAWEMSQAIKSEAGGFGDNGNSARVKGLRSLGWRQRYHNSAVYELDMFNGEVRLSVRQIKMGELTGLGTGANVWAAAHVLVKYMEKKYGRSGLEGKRVVDLGCGTGLTGLACLAMGAKEVYLTDQEQILFLAQENKERCSSILPVDRAVVAEYNWGGEDTALHPPFDVIIVSDCLLPKLFPIEPLVQALDNLSGPHTTTIVSYEHRHFPLYDPREYFTKLLVSRGLVRQRVEDKDLDQDYWADDIEVWEIRRGKEGVPTDAPCSGSCTRGGAGSGKGLDSGGREGSNESSTNM